MSLLCPSCPHPAHVSDVPAEGKCAVPGCTCEGGDPAAEVDFLADTLAHMSAAITGNLKPSVMYPGKPIRYIEEGLLIYRAAQLLAERVVKMREGREPSETEIAAELMWFLKVAEKELPHPLPQRKEVQ